MKYEAGRLIQLDVHNFILELPRATKEFTSFTKIITTIIFRNLIQLDVLIMINYHNEKPGTRGHSLLLCAIYCRPLQFRPDPWEIVSLELVQRESGLRSIFDKFTYLIGSKGQSLRLQSDKILSGGHLALC